MPRKPTSLTFPRAIKVGSVVVKIYRLPHKQAKDGFVYQVNYRDASGATKKPQFTDLAKAEDEARLQASKLATGQAEAAGMGRADRDELVAIRRVCGDFPPLTAINEWAKARSLTGGHVIAAAQAWAMSNGRTFSPILVEAGVDKFISAMNSAGRDGDRTYKAKLAPFKARFVGRELHTISSLEWSDYLAQFKNGVTRNDYRKRAITMCRWARSNGLLPKGTELEIMGTIRSDEEPPEIGLADPETYGRLLSYVWKYHPHHLAALILAGFCGVRSDEIHGKRKDRNKRQVWEGVHINPTPRAGHAVDPYVEVTNAKRNTPHWRHTPLCQAALDWLKLCPHPRVGNICHAGAMERIRDIGKSAGLDLPDNCLRHSYITYKIAEIGDKAQVATWAGTSVARIDKHYRQPVPQALGHAWFGMTPEVAAKLPQLKRTDLMGPDHRELSRKGGRIGGSAKTPAKKAAARRRNLGVPEA